jgi:Tfp pilus assembly protein PilX
VTVESTGESGAWTPGDALDDAGRVLEVTAGIVLVVGAVLAPFVVLALLAAGGGRVVRRRRREAALRPGG